MIYESTASFRIIDDNGNEKTVKESIILENQDTFTMVEAKTYEYFDGRAQLEVIAIKRSLLKEIANTRNDEKDSIFIAEVCDTLTDETGKEKEISYKVAFFSSSIDNAKTFIDQYLKQGYDMRLKALKETKFVDVI